jgi:GntR family transcriptional regulator
MLNPLSPIPLYHQLANIILEKIRSGEYPPGSRILSEHQLAARYGVGRPTARQATEFLVRKRILMRKRGAGTFVCGEHNEVDLFSLAGTTSAFNKKGIAVTTHIVQNIRLEQIRYGSNNPFSNKKAYFYSRLTQVEKVPVLIEDMYLHDKLFKDIDKIDLSRRSLSQIVDEHYYMKPSGGRQNFRIINLTDKKAKILEVTPDIPILFVKRFLNFEHAKNAIYSELYCRTDQFVFSQKIGDYS